MQAFKISGSRKVSGTITPQGAKNEALQILAAVLLTANEVEVSNLPAIQDVKNQIELLRGLNVEVTQVNDNTYKFKAKDVNLDYLRSQEFYHLGAAIRGSVMLLGPLLGRYGIGIIPKPGGDKIGRRRLDTHFIGLQNLGATFTFNEKESLYEVDAPHGLKGSYMLLEEASVTGTANVIMAAVLAKGVTQIYNAACEPYIQQLCKMLVSMGAIIEGAGTNLVTITGVETLGGTRHKCLADMIEVGSFIGLAAITQSKLTISGVDAHQLGLIPTYFRKLGINLTEDGDDLIVDGRETYSVESNVDGSIITIADAPWPGFTPDLLSIVLVTAIQAKGNVLIHQKMFESRLFFVDSLLEMGAQIILCDPHRATVIGLGRSHPLKGIKMRSPDIRAGVALLLAALSAEGDSTIYNIAQIDRGYESIDTRLNALGTSIERIEVGSVS